MAINASDSEAPERLPINLVLYIDGLLNSSTIEESRKEEIESRLELMTMQEAEKEIQFLLQHQKESLDKRFNRLIKFDD